MLRDFPTPARHALRARLVTVVGAGVIAALIVLPGCGIKRSLTLPPTPPNAATVPSPPAPAAAPAPGADPGAPGTKVVR